MIAYKRIVTIRDPKELVLYDLPFEPGQRVEILLLAGESGPGNSVAELERLFKTTQALPQARRITEEEIVAEIAAYRVGRESSD